MKHVCFWLTAGFVLFSFSGGFAKPTKAQLDSLEALQPALDITADVIQYDSLERHGPAKDTVTDENYWIGVKFTPTRSFNLQVVYYHVANPLISMEGCTIQVARDAGGSPGTIRLTDTVGAPLADRLRSLALEDSLEFGANEDFWILLGPVPGGPDNDNIGDGWWGLQTDSINTGRSKWRTGSTWVPHPGNWVLRAGGKYSPAPRVVINEVLFNADTLSLDTTSRNHEWVELYNPAAVQTTEGWEIRNGDETKSFLLPDGIQFDSGAFLVVHFASGTNDLDLSDFRGDVYANGFPQFFKDRFFDNRKDACGLWVGVTNPGIYSNYADIVAWNLKNLSIDPDKDGSTPLEAANYNFDFKPANKIIRIQPQDGIGPLLTANPGTSIGRDQFGSNPTSPPSGRNLNFVGGPNAAGPTMGGKNLMPMVFDSSGITFPDTASWTLMLYMAADYGDSLTSPDRWYYDLLNQIERVMPAGPDSVNVAVLFDSRRTHLSGSSGTYNATFKGALRYYDITDTVRNLKFISTSENTGLATTLSDFLSWAKDSFPASHYALALKGDGAGWEGLCGDATSGDRLEMGELKSALQSGLNGDSLDLIIFDAPLMSQLEVATQVKNFAHRMVASPEMTGPADFDYPRLVEAFMGGIDTSALVGTLKNILKDRTGKDPFAVWTIINLDKLDTIMRSVDTLATNMERGVADPCLPGNSADNFQMKIRTALTNFNTDHYGTQAQGMADFIDLRRFAIIVKALNDCGGGYKNGADGVISLLRRNGPVIEGLEGGGIVATQNFGFHRFLFFDGVGGGLSIYFPSARQKETPIFGKVFYNNQGPYNNRSDHPFDRPGLETEGGVWQSPRIYAVDMSACYPHPDDTCGHYLPPNYPYPPLPDFDFRDSTNWDEFLIRYYKPVAEIGGTGFFGLRLLQDTTFDASGSSDPDSDTLKYIWDFYSDRDTNLNCNSYLAEDIDKDCRDDSTDDADTVLVNQAQTPFGGFDLPGDREVWLHIWDETDNAEPLSNRRFQVSSAKADVQVDFHNVQLAFYDLTLRGLYNDALDSLNPPTSGLGIDLRTVPARTGMTPQRFIIDAGTAPQVIVFPGTESNDVFPNNMQVALDTALDNDDQGFWIAAKSMGTYAPGRNYFSANWNFPIPDSSRSSASSLVPVTGAYVGEHFLKGLGTLELLGGTQLLQRLEGIQSPSFPLLVTNTGDTVAAARVVENNRRAIVFSTFGLEQLANWDDRRALLEEILKWLTKPTPPPLGPCSRAKGDMDNTGTYTPADVVLMQNCVFLGSGACDLCYTDVNCTGTLTGADVALELNRIYLGSPFPCI